MIKPIITDIRELHKPCLAVEKGENLKDLIQDLKDTLEASGGLGISANQIGVQKKVSYIKIPKEFNKLTKKFEFSDKVLMNIKIIDKQNPVMFKNEGCTSFKGIQVNTRRYIYIVASFMNENFEEQTAMLQDIESIVIQHEHGHQNSQTLFEHKWKAR